MSYQIEFPDFDHEVPHLDCFRDTSWHNDVMPAFTSEPHDHQMFNLGYLTVTFWVNYMDKAEREFDSSPLLDIVIHSENQDPVSIMKADSWDELRANINEFVDVKCGETLDEMGSFTWGLFILGFVEFWSIDRKTQCWKCSGEYGFTEPKCPECGATNGNMDYEKAALEMRVEMLETQRFELMGIQADIQSGQPFDDVCAETLARVIGILAPKKK